MKTMDPMDIDEIVEVPDTPDRFAKQGIDGRSGVKLENHRSSLPFCGQQKFSEGDSRDQPMIIDSGSRGKSLHPPKRNNSPSSSHHSASFSLASSSSSRNSHLFRKGAIEKMPIYPSLDQRQDSKRPPRKSSYSNGIVDLTEKNSNRPVFGMPNGVPGNNRANGTSLQGLVNFPVASSSVNEGTNNVSRAGSRIGLGEGKNIVGNDNSRPGNGSFVSPNPVASPRVPKQKRLVRNGCISPNNIAKAKQLAGKDINCSVAVAHNNGSSASIAPISADIRELVAENSDSHTKEGKGMISLQCSSMEQNLPSRGVSTCNEESSGWRSTYNRAREMNMSLPGKEHCFIRERDTPRCPSQRHENGVEKREKGISVASGDDYSKEPSSTSFEHVRPLKESASHFRVGLGRANSPRSPADAHMKRQKQGSTSSNCGECSTSASDDPEVLLSEVGKSIPSSRNVGNLPQIIEVDECSPQPKQNAHDEGAKARQVEADELLARELQEQFYNEMPVFAEVDEHIALALQHQEGSNHGSTRARRPVPDARLTPNLHRQSQSRSSSNAPRRGALARASALGRMTRLRSRFPGQPRTLLPSRGRNSIFPPDMDVDMRMHILGALEEFNDMEMNAGILQANRDFNENDYEMLLALDENNHQHGGASIHQINGLPQSMVQSDNFEEACAICLDTPTVGDTIRHLPCLHKFHKDCIDPWLRRRTSCPVCKSSIT